MNESETQKILEITAQLNKSERMDVLSSIADICNSIHKKISPDFSLNEACRELFYNHRSDGLSEIYFFINLSDKAVEREITFRAPGKTEICDQVSGEIKSTKAVLSGKKSRL